MKILILEDEQAARTAMQRYLQISGHDVEAVGSPEDAIDTAATFGAEVLLFDWELGAELDGVDVARKLQRNGEPKIIFITGQSLAELRRAASDLKVRAFYQKPVSMPEIKAVLAAH